MTSHRIGMREEWLAASAALLDREKELTRMGDELARQRRELPWLPVEKQYTLQTADGPKTLEELFDGRSQLLIYHFMFSRGAEDGCPTNSSIAELVRAMNRRRDIIGFAPRSQPQATPARSRSRSGAANPHSSRH